MTRVPPAALAAIAAAYAVLDARRRAQNVAPQPSRWRLAGRDWAEPVSPAPRAPRASRWARAGRLA